METILFIMLVLVIYIMFIFKSKDEKKDMMCLEKCNMKDCSYCIDKEQCNDRRRWTIEIDIVVLKESLREYGCSCGDDLKLNYLYKSSPWSNYCREYDITKIEWDNDIEKI